MRRVLVFQKAIGKVRRIVTPENIVKISKGSVQYYNFTLLNVILLQIYAFE